MIKRLLRSVREFKLPSLLTPLFVTLEAVMEVIIPYLMADLIDRGITAGKMDYIVKMGLALLISSFMSLFFGAVAGKYAAIASSGFARNLRHDMYYNIQKYSFSNIDKFSTASIVTRLTTDITNVQGAYQMSIRMACRAPAMLILSLVMAFRVNAQLSLVFLCCIPVLAVGLYIIIRKAHPIFERVFKTYDKLNSVVQENLRGIRVVKSFVREDHEIGKFDKISGDIYRDFSKAEKTVAYNMPLMQFCMYGAMLAISWFGARLIISTGGSALTTGQLTSMITYVMQILISLMMLSMVFVMIVISRASMERIDEVLREKSDITSPENAVTEVADGSITFDHVGFSYSKSSDKPVLDDVCLDIKSGQTVGIIGGTGSSKSSLVALIPRLYDAVSGCVSVGGIDVRCYDIEALRSSVAMVLQKNELFSGTIKDNLRWGAKDATDEEIERVCRLAQADSFIQTFPDKYDTYIEQGGTNVSGGQKQRLCIARALLKKPKILILDDSTSAVDTRTDALIRQAFFTEIPDTTKIIIAQRISSVSDADMIIVMDNGHVSAVGNHDELIKTSEIYREVYTSQMKGANADE